MQDGGGQVGEHLIKLPSHPSRDKGQALQYGAVECIS
jgi:hypothetical protein